MVYHNVVVYICSFKCITCVVLAIIFAKIGLKNIDPAVAITIRSIVMVLVVLVLLILVKSRYIRSEIIKLKKKNYMYLVLSDLMSALSWVVFLCSKI